MALVDKGRPANQNGQSNFAKFCPKFNTSTSLPFAVLVAGVRMLNFIKLSVKLFQLLTHVLVEFKPNPTTAAGYELLSASVVVSQVR